jgi:uncharacterized cupredoxin-like copper-binding protein
MSLRPRSGAVSRLHIVSWWIVAACAVAVLAGGCGSTAQSATGGAVIAVTERDFHVATSKTHVATGAVVLRVYNNGPDQHELIVVPERAGGLPIRADGFTVNEEAIQSSEPGALEPGLSGATRYLRLNLRPGRYVLFCNMAGHYMAGMHAELTVGS